MKKMAWCNFLHIYQPPHQDKQLVNKIFKESYQKIVATLFKFPQVKITLNINGSLTELLSTRQAFFRHLKELIKKGQIELVGSAKYHPILPLLNKEEVIRQIQLNNETNKKVFGEDWQPRGFYFPEMAYSRKAARVVKELGFKWIILDEISRQGTIGDTPFNKKYIIKDLDLPVVFRNRYVSKTFVPEEIFKLLKNNSLDQQYLISATDGELYGHHHIDRQRYLAKILKNENLKTVTVSELLSLLRQKVLVQPIDSSWESTEEEIKKGIPYALWYHPKNNIHKKCWQLADLGMTLIKKCPDDDHYEWARHFLDQGLASCTFWWASEKKPSPFSPITWHPDEVEKGINLIIRSIRSLDCISRPSKLEAEKLYIDIKKIIWQKHWRKHWSPTGK